MRAMRNDTAAFHILATAVHGAAVIRLGGRFCPRRATDPLARDVIATIIAGLRRSVDTRFRAGTCFHRAGAAPVPPAATAAGAERRAPPGRPHPVTESRAGRRPAVPSPARRGRDLDPPAHPSYLRRACMDPAVPGLPARPRPVRGRGLVPAGVAGLLGLLAACGGGPAATPAAGGAVVAVDIVRVVRQPVTRLLRVTGSLTADQSAEVAAETGGRVVETPVERGSQVPAGAPLIRLAAAEAEAGVQEAEANVAQIEVRLGISGDQDFDAERVPEVSNARAAMRLAAAEFGRIKQLYDERVVSGSEFDQRRTQMEVTERAYDAARNNARQLARQLEATRARLTLARKALADTVVRAPFGGVVAERRVNVGDYVTRGTRVATVVRIQPLRLELTVPEQHLAILRPGLDLHLEVDAYPGREFPGQVRYVSPAVQPEQRAFVVEAVVPNAEGLLRPGLFVVAAIRQSDRDEALFVPSAALRVLDGSSRLYVLSGDRVEERMVTTGQVVGALTEIVQGVTDGDAVAATNVSQLADGTRVRPVTAGSGGTAG